MGRRRRDVVWCLNIREDLDERWLRYRYAESARDVWGTSKESVWDGAYRIAASPKLLLSVCMTQRFAYSDMRDTALLSGLEKSI